MYTSDVTYGIMVGETTKRDGARRVKGYAQSSFSQFGQESGSCKSYFNLKVHPPVTQLVLQGPTF